MALNSNRRYGFETLSLHAGQETADSARSNNLATSIRAS